MAQNQSIWIVIPAYNEEKTISSVVRELQGLNYQILVVDDASKDLTEARALEAGAQVCRHPINLGQGASLQTGIIYALRNQADFIVTFDADGQHRAIDIEALLDPLRAEKAQVALGSRFAAGGSSEGIPAAKKLLLAIAILYTRLTTGLRLSDTHNGLRALTATAAAQINITQNRMAHASQIVSEIARLKIPYVEVPVQVRYTDYAIEKGQPMSNFFNILWESLTEVMRR